MYDFLNIRNNNYLVIIILLAILLLHSKAASSSCPKISYSCGYETKIECGSSLAALNESRVNVEFDNCSITSNPFSATNDLSESQETTLLVNSCEVKTSSSNVKTCVNCEHPDFGGLMELYSSTDGPNWTDNSGWAEGAEGTNCDPCNGWYGIECTNNRVTSIILNKNNLSGTIPDFQNLLFLQNLY